MGWLVPFQCVPNYIIVFLFNKDFEKQEDGKLKELRIRDPFPELLDYFQKAEFEKYIKNPEENLKGFSEIPYPVFLRIAICNWLRDNINIPKGNK